MRIQSGARTIDGKRESTPPAGLARDYSTVARTLFNELNPPPMLRIRGHGATGAGAEGREAGFMCVDAHTGIVGCRTLLFHAEIPVYDTHHIYGAIYDDQ
jgi:hypothetical protein